MERAFTYTIRAPRVVHSLRRPSTSHSIRYIVPTKIDVRQRSEMMSKQPSAVQKPGWARHEAVPDCHSMGLHWTIVHMKNPVIPAMITG